MFATASPEQSGSTTFSGISPMRASNSSGSAALSPNAAGRSDSTTRLADCTSSHAQADAAPSSASTLFPPHQLHQSRASTTSMHALATASSSTLSIPSELVERSAFAYGLLYSPEQVCDVSAVVQALRDAAVVASSAAGGAPPLAADPSQKGRRPFPDREPAPPPTNHTTTASPSKSGLCGVFYFPEKLLVPDMPWRHAYASLILLCVFASPEAARQARDHLNAVPTLLPGGPTTDTSGGDARSGASAGASVAREQRIVLRPASEYNWSPADIDTALLSFLPTSMVAEVLWHRRTASLPASYIGGGDPFVSEGGGVASFEDVCGNIRTNQPPPRVCGPIARLYASILSFASPYSVDWTAAQAAVQRGDGVVIQEMAVVAPWVGGTRLFPDGTGASASSSEGPWGGTLAVEAFQDSTGAVGGSEPDATRAASASAVARKQGQTSEGSIRAPHIPRTLQEAEYYRRYGDGTNSGGSSRHFVSRGIAYAMRNPVSKGLSWVARHVWGCFGDAEAPLMMSTSGASASLALPPPSSNAHCSRTRSASRTSLTKGIQITPQSADSGLMRDRTEEEPPLRRYRGEGVNSGGSGSDGLNRLPLADTRRARASGQGRNDAIVIPRYNAVGVALSWMPIFPYISNWFVTSTTVLTPRGALPRPVTAQQQQRRRARDADWRGAFGTDNPAWDVLVQRRYAAARAGEVSAYAPSSAAFASPLPAPPPGSPPPPQQPPPLQPQQQHSEPEPPVKDSVLSWMSPMRGTGWPAPAAARAFGNTTDVSLPPTSGGSASRPPSWLSAATGSVPSSPDGSTAVPPYVPFTPLPWHRASDPKTQPLPSTITSFPETFLTPRAESMSPGDTLASSPPPPHQSSGRSGRGSIHVERVRTPTGVQHSGSEASHFLRHLHATPPASSPAEAPREGERPVTSVFRRRTDPRSLAEQLRAAEEAQNAPSGSAKPEAAEKVVGLNDSNDSDPSSRRSVRFTLPGS